MPKKLGERGPPPTPSSIKKLRGTYVNTENPGEPMPDAVDPEIKAPRGMSARARKAWPSLVGMLDRMRVLSEVDLNLVRRYLETWALWLDAQEWINKNGQTIEEKKFCATEPQRDPDGVPLEDSDGEYILGAYVTVGHKVAPQVALVNKYLTQLLKIEREFGMSPSSRTRISVNDTPKRGRGRPPGSKEDHERAAAEAETRAASGDGVARDTSKPQLKVVK